MPRWHAFFDLGGTLVDLRVLHAAMSRRIRREVPGVGARAEAVAREWMVATARRIRGQHGRRFAPEKVVALRALRDVLREAGHPVTASAGAGMLRGGWLDFVARARLCPDVTKPWLRALGRRTAGLALITDGDDDAIGILLDATRLAPLFRTVTTSESVGAYKPRREVFLAALEALGAEPATSWFVSDSVSDVWGADRLGFRTVLRTTVFPGDRDPPRRTVRLASLREFGPLLREGGRS